MVFSLTPPVSTPQAKARALLAAKPKSICLRNVQTIINFCVPHQELGERMFYWEQVKGEILTASETFENNLS